MVRPVYRLNTRLKGADDPAQAVRKLFALQKASLRVGRLTCPQIRYTDSERFSEIGSLTARCAFAASRH